MIAPKNHPDLLPIVIRPLPPMRVLVDLAEIGLAEMGECGELTLGGLVAHVRHQWTNWEQLLDTIRPLKRERYLPLRARMNDEIQGRLRDLPDWGLWSHRLTARAWD